MTSNLHRLSEKCAVLTKKRWMNEKRCKADRTLLMTLTVPRPYKTSFPVWRGWRGRGSLDDCGLATSPSWGTSRTSLLWPPSSDGVADVTFSVRKRLASIRVVCVGVNLYSLGVGRYKSVGAVLVMPKGRHLAGEYAGLTTYDVRYICFGIYDRIRHMEVNIFETRVGKFGRKKRWRLIVGSIMGWNITLS
ncbi:hypothetical protein E2C01_028559 [Portunus trituberculatus]|uniref:Uncharacterized protein n=1 Tax=Portunus trituberculatus TaxID=210409 RepID=A0A5B7ELV2_PORTR|nr:hypothetical protein [Portunus trituberculatus]